MPKQKLDRNIFTLGWVSLFTDISSEMVYPLMPVFLSATLGVGIAFIGIIEGIAESTASLLKIFSGWLSDKIQRRKPIILAGYSLSTIVKPFLYIATSGWQVLGVRVIDRLGKGLRTSPRDALVANSCPPDLRGKAFGIQRAMDSFGAFLGPLVAFIILASFNNNYRLVFLLAFFPALIAVILIILFLKEKFDRSAPAVQQTVSKPTINLSLKGYNRKFKIFIFIFSVFTLGNSSNAFLILRAKELGVGITAIPIIWLVYNFLSSASAIPFGSLSDRLGRAKVISLGFLIYAAVYFGFAFAKTQSQAWILFAFYGLYSGVSEGVFRAYVADTVTDSSKTATAYGIFNGVEGLLILPASLLMGILWRLYGAKTAFSLGASLSLLSCVFFLVLLNRKNIIES